MRKLPKDLTAKVPMKMTAKSVDHWRRIDVSDKDKKRGHVALTVDPDNIEVAVGDVVYSISVIELWRAVYSATVELVKK